MCNSGDSSTTEAQRFSMFVPTLEMLAVQQISFVLYRKEIHPCSAYDFDDGYGSDWHIDPYFNPKEIIVGLPSVFSKMIKKCMERFAAISITNWCLYHNSHVFFEHCTRDSIGNCIDEFVLKPDGQINYRSTAKNIIMGDKLNLVEKYRLACLYCLVDDVRRIWPMVQDNPKITELTNPIYYPMIHYWNCVMKGEAPRFPGTDPNSLEECLVILARMRWDSIEYFWNTLSTDEQVTAAKKLLIIDEELNTDEDLSTDEEWSTDEKLRTQYIEPLLLRLDETQLRRIMREIPVVEMFSDDLGYFRASECTKIFHIWNYIKHFISPPEFLEIIDIFTRCFRSESEYGALLFEVWTSASDEFKSAFLNNFEDSVKNGFQRLQPRLYCSDDIEQYSDMRFFVDVLTSTGLDLQSKKTLWFEFWPKLIIHTSPKYLDLMMKACFQKEDEIIQFKERYMMNFDEIKEFCQCCFEAGHISKLDNFLNYSSSNINQVVTMKQQIIRSENFLVSFWFNAFAGQFRRAVDDLSKFIDSASFNEEEAANHKKNYSNSRLRTRSVFDALSEEPDDS